MGVNSLGEPYEGTAVILADDMVNGENCKTTHALIRKSNRYQILGVVDACNTGNDAGVLLDGVKRDIAVYSSIENMVEAVNPVPDFCIVGIAPSGGRLTSSIKNQLMIAIRNGMSVVSGLHEHVSNDEMLVQAAREHKVDIIDVRKSKPIEELAFWSGEIASVTAPRIAVLGTDCDLGKRTTTQFLIDECNANGIKAEMVYTGQTGWMQGGKYGFILDSTVNDFVSGELEKAIVECDRDMRPDVIFIEGQSGLRNPSGPCGSELLLSAQAKAVILQHAPGLKNFQLGGKIEYPMPPLKEELELIKLYGGTTLGVCLNGKNIQPDGLGDIRSNLEDELGVPVIDVLSEGVSRLLPLIREYIVSG